MIIEAREVWLKDGEKLTLRSPIANDANALLENFAIVAGESYRNMNQPKDYWTDFPVAKEVGILEAFAHADNRFMVSAFTADGTIVGNIGCFGGEYFSKHSARIGMGIRESYSGRGLGNQLLRTVIFEASAKGFTRLDLTVRTFNAAGIALYEKVGFKRVGHLHSVAMIDGEACDEYQYELVL